MHIYGTTKRRQKPTFPHPHQHFVCAFALRVGWEVDLELTGRTGRGGEEEGRNLYTYPLPPNPLFQVWDMTGFQTDRTGRQTDGQGQTDPTTIPSPPGLAFHLVFVSSPPPHFPTFCLLLVACVYYVPVLLPLVLFLSCFCVHAV